MGLTDNRFRPSRKPLRDLNLVDDAEKRSRDRTIDRRRVPDRRQNADRREVVRFQADRRVRFRRSTDGLWRFT